MSQDREPSLDRVSKVLCVIAVLSLAVDAAYTLNRVAWGLISGHLFAPDAFSFATLDLAGATLLVAFVLTFCRLLRRQRGLRS